MRVRGGILSAICLLLAVSPVPGCGGTRSSGSGAGMKHVKEWYAKIAPGHEPPPAWVFCLPQKDDTLYGLGFAMQNMYGDDATRQNAYDNAIHNLARSIKVSVKARSYTQTEVDGISVNDNQLIEKEQHIDGEVEQRVRDKAGQVDCWSDASTGVTWVLAAVSLSDFEQIKVSAGARSRCTIGERPKWLSKPPLQKGVLFGYGEASMNWNPATSYREAEELALVEISNQIKAQIRTFTDSVDSDSEDYTYRIVRIATEETLSGSDIVERWVDFKTGTAYALARMPLISVKARILAAAKKVEAEEKAKAVEERRESSAAEIERKADAALDMMDKALEKNFGGTTAPANGTTPPPAEDGAASPDDGAAAPPAEGPAAEPADDGGSGADDGTPEYYSPPEATGDGTDGGE